MNEQERVAWMADRCGKITASRISDVLAKATKGAKESASRRNYRAELVCERLTKRTAERYESWDMKRGTELEPFARSEYELARGTIIENVGFIPHPRIPNTGASPDGLINKDGLVQFKCPKTATHLDWMMAGIVPAEHRPQMLWEMACTNRQWCDFVSYDPNLSEDLQLFIVRFDRDEVAIGELEAEVQKFDAEIENIIAALKSQKSLGDRLAESIAMTKQKKTENALYVTEEDVRA
jgi:putative phage-type endonuclease